MRRPRSEAEAFRAESRSLLLSGALTSLSLLLLVLTSLASALLSLATLA